MWSCIILLLLCNQAITTNGDLFYGVFHFMEYIPEFISNYFSKYSTTEQFPETYMNTVEIIQYYGYPAEAHYVTTDDGYTLEIQRIPGKNYNSTKINEKNPVLLQHGFLSGSSTWIINGINDSLGFILADDSYDVWLGNIRGNDYGKQHKYLTPQHRKFFDYSLDDHALLDLPAIIDYILNTTGKEKLTYIGHSQGTLTSCLLLAGKPEYNDKIHLAVLLAPVYYSQYARNPLRIIGNNYKVLVEMYRTFIGEEIFPFIPLIRKLIPSICSTYPGEIICEIVIKIVSGYGDEFYDRKRSYLNLIHSIHSSSVKTIIHYSQGYSTGKPARFDYGPDINLKKYGQIDPPVYNLSKISTQMVLFHGYMDLFTDQKDVQKLADNLPNLKLKEQVAKDTFAHHDFIFGKDLRKNFYDRLLQVIKQYE